MSSCSRVALVTGGNKGIGFAITRDLCRKFSGDVVLTARDEARGKAAVQQLQAEGLSPRFHQLDIDDLQSIRALRDFLRKEYGGLDVLVNNAGVAFKVADTTPFHIQAEETMKTNFFGTRDVCTELLPLIKPQGRVVNVSSMVSLRALKNCSPELQQKFRSETITEEELVGLMNKFVEDTKKGVHEKEGWPNSAYGVTKIGVTVLSRIHARKLNEQRRGDKILLNACCPGWVALVTGANKGIGFAITRDLCQKFSGDVVLTARNQARGQAAVQQLLAEGLNPRFHQLDIDDLQSIRALRDFLLEEYGGLDVLINNAGISTWPKNKPPKISEFFKDTQPGRVVNISSKISFVALKKCSPELQQKFRSETITEEELVGLMNKFVEDTKKGVHEKEGWPNSAYAVTKIGVTVLSRIHARKLNEQRRGDKILLNVCCPGWVRTDMAGPNATKSPEEGAETPVYLALLPPDAEGPHGQFVQEKKVEQW
ncbi:hypothetical protein STEG23_002725 [Scotinomys teguina]